MLEDPVRTRPGLSSQIRILLVDDHAIFRAGLVALLGIEKDLRVVGEAEDSASALRCFDDLLPDVTLMEVRLPDGTGTQVLREIRGRHATACVIMFGAYDTEEEICAAMHAGARGYVLKNIRKHDLVSTIRRAHGGETCLSAEMEMRVAERNTSPCLSSREVEVLQLIAKGLCNPHIAKLLHLSEQTVKTHIKHILSKLNASDRTEAVVAAIRRGIINP